MIVRPKPGESQAAMVNRFLRGSQEIVKEAKDRQFHLKNNKKAEIKRLNKIKFG